MIIDLALGLLSIIAAQDITTSPEQDLLGITAIELSAARDFKVSDVRHVRLGRVVTAGASDQYLICGEFQHDHETGVAGKLGWSSFATIKTNGHETYFGASAKELCKRPTVRWSGSQALTDALRLKLVSSR